MTPPPAPPTGSGGRPPAAGPKTTGAPPPAASDDPDATQLSPNSEFPPTAAGELLPAAEGPHIAPRTDPRPGDETVVVLKPLRMPPPAPSVAIPEAHADATQILPAPAQATPALAAPPPPAPAPADHESDTSPPSTLSPPLTDLPLVAPATAVSYTHLTLPTNREV